MSALNRCPFVCCPPGDNNSLTFDWSLSLLPLAETLSLHSLFPLLQTQGFIMDFVNEKNEKNVKKIKCDISSSFIGL